MIEWESRDLTLPPYWDGMPRTYEVTASLGKRFVRARLHSRAMPDLLFYCALMERVLRDSSEGRE